MANKKIQLTGNPFVDTGLAVVGSLAKLDDIEELSVDDLKKIYGNGSKLIQRNAKLKVFSQIFGTNGPLFQTAYGFKKGIGPSEDNKNIYKTTVEGLLTEVGKPSKGSKCWACGNPSDFNFGDMCKKAIESNGKKVTGEKYLGRDWFPLAGSLGNDAQALPAASQPPHICPQCLYAIHYLPSGLILLDGRLAVFQCTSKELWYELVRDIVNDVDGRINAGLYETLGKKEGSKAVMRRLISLFQRLQKEKHLSKLPEETSLYIWKFSNSGTSPECLIEEIPNPAITFLWEATLEGLGQEIESLLGSEGKDPRFSLFNCILEKRDYLGLYPEGRRQGASPKLYSLYQRQICNHSSKALEAAFKIAKEIATNKPPKELKRIQKSEAFRDSSMRNQARAQVVNLTEQGELTLDEYLNLFPPKHVRGTITEWKGWNIIRYYLHHFKEEEIDFGDIYTMEESKSMSVRYYAASIYNQYITDKGATRFRKEIISQAGRRISVGWLRSQFIKLAETQEGFTYNNWSDLCKLDNGRIYISELLFQMRLLWIEWLREDKQNVEMEFRPQDTENDLSTGIVTLLNAFFQDYIDKRGLERFHNNVLLRLRKKELGVSWFKEMLTQSISDISPMTAQEWERFLVDASGKSIAEERIFQLHLYLSNLYRNKMRGN